MTSERSAHSRAHRLDLLSTASLTSEEFSSVFNKSFALAAFIVNRHLVDHFMRASRQLGVDYEALIIWAVLAHQNCAHLMPPGSLPAAVLNEAGRLRDDHAGLRPLRLRDLSQITGIPRETVRRKLRLLHAAGRVDETDGGWLVSAEHADELRAFTEESARRFLAAAADLLRTLEGASEVSRG
jgi:predicted transcriptional regulator